MSLVGVIVEFENLQAGVRHAFEISPALSDAEFILDGAWPGISIGCPDDPGNTNLLSFTISSRSISFRLSADTPSITLRASINSGYGLLFGRVATSTQTTTTVSNGTVSANLFGPTYWTLPIDYWESPAIGALLGEVATPTAQLPTRSGRSSAPAATSPPPASDTAK